MSAARRDIETEEPDRILGQPHPRETYELLGHDLALARASRAIRAGRPPQAWLISGPPGIGKATLAYRIARYLLRHGASPDGPEDLAVPPEHMVSRQIAAQSHSGLLVLKRRLNDRGKLKTVLDVDEVRRLGGFFGMTAGAGGWRIAIVDAADEMNDNAANALLKLLEEPPARGLIMLVSHAPGSLLPTIRSRAQRLDLKPLEAGVMSAALVKRLPAVTAADRARLVDIADGSLGAALQLSGDEGLKLAQDAERLLSAGAAPDMAAILALAERVSRGTDNLPQFGRFLGQALSRRIRERARQAQGDARAVELWERLHSLFERAAGLHLEPRQSILAAARDIRETQRSGAL